MKKIEKLLNKELSVKTALKVCGLVLLLGLILVYASVISPLKTEVVQYRTAGYWMGFLSMNPDFGRPIGAAWKGNDFVTVYASGNKLVVTPSETYALDPEGFRAKMSFKIFPEPDVRRNTVGYLEKVAATIKFMKQVQN